jgi:ABC-type multidrug transport system permease subunit
MTSSRSARYSPLLQLVLARCREFYREPEAVFWSYGFPLLMATALGFAFRNKPAEQFAVDVLDSAASDPIVARLIEDQRFKVQVSEEFESRRRLRTGVTDLVVSLGRVEGELRFDYLFDPTRPASLVARNAADDALQRAAGRQDVAGTADHSFDEPGGRYIDFLVPGLIGMSLMGGGLWGVGFVTVDMRIRKILKRFLATPMKKHQFLGGLMISRLLFLIPEVVTLLLFAQIVFGVRNHGSLVAVIVLILIGAAAFAGLGLLVASRAKTIEAVSGLMNLVMLPMWIASGIFFQSSRFPDEVQPIIKALPLTQLNNALRAVMLEGHSLTTQWPNIVGLSLWGVVTSVIALRWFRWS